MLIESQEQLSEFIENIARIDDPVVIDTETTWVDRYQDRKILGISIYSGGHSCYIPIGHEPTWGEDVPSIIIPSDLYSPIESDTRPIIYHNAVFDEIVHERADIKLPRNPVYCTMLMAHLDNENFSAEAKTKTGEKKGYDLSTVAQRYVSKDSVKEKALAKHMVKYGWEKVPPVVMAKYAEQDALLPDLIYRELKPRFLQTETYWLRERKISKIIEKMIMKGIPLELDGTKRLKEQCEQQLKEVNREIGFDPAKLGDARKRLFNPPPYGLGIEATHRTPTGLAQINKDFLDACNHPIAGLIKQNHEITKQLTAYYNPYINFSDDDGRIHAGFKQHGTVTGRWSCADPNLHQIPRESPVKKLFLPEAGRQLWEIDYRNIEWRMGAVYANESRLLEFFRNEQDMHAYVAEQLGVTRQQAKIGGFTYLFLGGPDAVVEQLRVPYSVADKFIKGMKALWTNIEATKKKATTAAANNGYIKIWSGRIRHFDDPRYAYTAFNFLTQGGSFEIVKESMIKLDEAGFDIRNCVHDSMWLMVDSEKEAVEAQHIMEDWTEEMFGLKFTTDRKRLN